MPKLKGGKMKKQKIYYMYLLISFLILAASAEGEKKWSDEEKREYLSEIALKQKTGIWDTKFQNGCNILVFKKDVKDASIEKIISILNTELPKKFNPKVKFIKEECNTVYLDVLDEDLLSDRMGTSGAEDYLAIVTYSLTSLDNIDFVYFNLVEGTHARPGKYGRLDFYRHWPL